MPERSAILAELWELWIGAEPPAEFLAGVDADVELGTFRSRRDAFADYVTFVMRELGMEASCNPKAVAAALLGHAEEVTAAARPELHIFAPAFR